MSRNRRQSLNSVINTHSLVFLKIDIDGSEVGDLWITLSPRVYNTNRNFMFLCSGQKGYGYQDTELYYIKPGYICCGGAGVGNQSKGKSIYGGGAFRDENFTLKHSKRGVIAMHTSGPDSNTSLFHITFGKVPQLDGNNVVFGEMIEGFDVLDAIEAAGSESGKPTKSVRIIDCGRYNERTHGLILPKLQMQYLQAEKDASSSKPQIKINHS